MPPETFLMTGGATPYRPADACPVTDGPHIAPVPGSSLLVADVATADSSAAVRIVLWRCRYCGTQLIGLGDATAPVEAEAGRGAHTQDYAWMEEDTALLGIPGPSGRSEHCEQR